MIEFTNVFQLAKGHSLNVYIDFKYAFHILLDIWMECGLLTMKGGSVTNSGYIMDLLKCFHLPKAIGIIHCQSHQTDSSIISKGNNWADHAARTAAFQSPNLSQSPQGFHTVQPAFSQTPPDTQQILSYLHRSFILIVKLYFMLSRLTCNPPLST